MLSMVYNGHEIIDPGIYKSSAPYLTIGQMEQSARSRHVTLEDKTEGQRLLGRNE